MTCMGFESYCGLPQSLQTTEADVCVHVWLSMFHIFPPTFPKKESSPLPLWCTAESSCWYTDIHFPIMYLLDCGCHIWAVSTSEPKLMPVQAAVWLTFSFSLTCKPGVNNYWNSITKSLTADTSLFFCLPTFLMFPIDLTSLEQALLLGHWVSRRWQRIDIYQFWAAIYFIKN